MEKKSIALVALGILIGMALFAPFSPFQMGVLKQPATGPPGPAPTLQKFKAMGYSPSYEGTFLVIDAGTERGIWSNNGLAPEWISRLEPQSAALIEKQVASGVKIGLFALGDVLQARSNGVPIKIVAAFIGEQRANKIYVKGDGPIKSMKDLDGKKIAVARVDGGTATVATFLSKKFEIKPEIVPVGNETNAVVALKVGKVEAFSGGFVSTLRLVDSGELRILAVNSDFLPKPYAAVGIFATEDLIEQNPDLVKRFVKATLESVRYLDENPKYVADLYIKRSNAPRNLAEKIPSQYEWTPGGRGNPADLFLAVKNRWEQEKQFGSVPAVASLKIEDAVDVRFLP